MPHQQSSKQERHLTTLPNSKIGSWHFQLCDIVQEAVIKTIPKKKKCKKVKWLSEKALQIAVKRREVKRKVIRKDIPMSLSIFQFVVIHTVKGFNVVNETEVKMFFWNSLAFSIIQCMVTI